MKTVARANWEEIIPGGSVEHKNDIYLVNGDIAFVYDKDCVAQVVESVVKTIRGEIQINTGFGIPYFGTVFENNRSADAWASAVKSAVSELDGVKSIESFDYHYEFDKKKLSYTMQIKTADGETVEVSE